MILAAECMDLLDGTIVNVASPSIRAELGTSLTDLQWIVGGYALTFAVCLVVGGRLGDLYGRRRLFLIGIAGFTLASVLCGVADSAGELIAFRLLQGGFAAIMIPQGFGIIRASFPKEEIAKAFGMFGPVIGGARRARPDHRRRARRRRPVRPGLARDLPRQRARRHRSRSSPRCACCPSRA